jgi:GAF domain-containing protein
MLSPHRRLPPRAALDPSGACGTGIPAVVVELEGRVDESGSTTTPVAVPPTVQLNCGPSADAERLRSLAHSGLGARPDPVMDAIADRVRKRLGVPVALVSLVQPEQQVFPGMAGLPQPWAARRSTPLTHSFCQHVVASARPLIVEDARRHPLVRDNLAVADLGVVAYAGMPLFDESGHVLGSLCAIDDHPRRWTPVELDTLRDLADLCSTELRRRLTVFDTEVERGRRDQLERQLRRSADRSRLLLAAAEAFSDTVTVADVRHRMSELVGTDLRPSYVGLAVLGIDGRLHRVRDPHAAKSAEDTGPWAVYGIESTNPTSTAVRERRVVHYPDRATFDADHPEPTRRILRTLDIHAVVAVPLPHVNGPMGALVLGWNTPRRLDPDDLLVITTIAGYTAQALARAELLSHRDAVARELQQAMLTTLPTVPGVQTAARYRPAELGEHVGGDWYDATLLAGAGGAPVLTVSVGDVTGHGVHAATIMGQVRSMLRQAACDHLGAPPSVVLDAFERAATALGLRATGTAVLAQVHRAADGRPTLRWSNAGHPPPVLLGPDGGVTLLETPGFLLGYPHLAPAPRRDHQLALVPGSTLFFYTDGLVERRGRDIDTGIDLLVRFLQAHRDLPVQELVDHVVDALSTDTADDVVAFAVRLTA